MATGNKQPLTVRVEEETAEGVGEYQDEIGADDRSDAHREILEVGLREVQGPVSHQFREMALNAAYYLSLVALVIVVLGTLPGTIGYARSLRVGLVLVCVAVAPVALIEVARALAGQSELSGVFGGDGR